MYEQFQIEWVPVGSNRANGVYVAPDGDFLGLWKDDRVVSLFSDNGKNVSAPSNWRELIIVDSPVKKETEQKFVTKKIVSRFGQYQGDGVWVNADGAWLGFWANNDFYALKEDDGSYCQAPDDWREYIIHEVPQDASKSVRKIYTEDITDVTYVLLELHDQIVAAMSEHPPYHSLHEAYGIIAEEFKEVEEWVFTKQKNRDPEEIREELMHLAVTAIRTILSCGPDYQK